METPAPGTIVVWSDLACPWSHVAVAKALDAGTARRTLMDQAERAAADGVRGSPHLFLPDGTDVHNPGVELHWEGEKGRGFPVVDSDDPSAHGDLVRRAAVPAGA